MLQRVVTGGTGTAAGLPGRPVAGKTGTAQDYTNVYFAGYTPQVATAVWIGFPFGQIPMDTYYGDSVFGGTVAAPIWRTFMEKAMQGSPVEGFEAPPAPQSGRVPDVLGLSSEEAQTTLAEANFTPIVEKVDSSEQLNTVISQDPGGGAKLPLGAGVHIQVSNGKAEPVLVPRVTGLTEKKAVAILEDAGLLAEVTYVDAVDPAQVGIVLIQIPIGNKAVDPGSTVAITVGRAPGTGATGTGATGATGPSG